MGDERGGRVDKGLKDIEGDVDEDCYLMHAYRYSIIAMTYRNDYPIVFSRVINLSVSPGLLVPGQRLAIILFLGFQFLVV